MRPRFFTDRNLGRQFPTLLRDAGIEVVAHDDRFPQTTPDEEWLPRAGREGWVVLTRDQQIRWRANQRDLVMEHAVALFALSGSGRTPSLAELVVQNLAAIERFSSIATRRRSWPRCFRPRRRGARASALRRGPRLGR